MIKYRSISEVSDCPFYVEDTKNKKHCFVKYLNTFRAAASTIDNDNEEDEDLWNHDCEANWDGNNCVFLRLLYDMSEDDEQERDDEQESPFASVENYDPFSDEEDEPVDEQEEFEQTDVILKIKKVSDPYLVGADVLVYPTNVTLLIDDDLLNRHSRFRIQEECEAYVRSMDIQIGDVYPTSNGGDLPGGVIPKRIYHAVVAGPSRLVSHNIAPAITQSLILADKEGAEIVAMLPFDCGMMDINETARIQLKAVKEFIEKGKTKNIKLICIIMDDNDSFEIFKEYYERIMES